MRRQILTPGATANKVIASIALLCAAAAIAGLGTFATFTSSTSTSHTIASGTLSLRGAHNRLGTGASAIAAGDTMQRAIDLNYAGTVYLGSATLTTNASTSSGARHRLDRRPPGRDRQVLGGVDGVGAAYMYTCGGTPRRCSPPGPLIGSNVALSNLTLTAGTTDHLRVTVTLPSTAGNALQNLSSTVGYTFTGVQRAGTNQ